MLPRLLLILLLAVPAPALLGQPPQEDDRPARPAPPADPEPVALPRLAPLNPRDELFLAIELNDVDAARTALRNGAEIEINRGNPSPLATATLHDNLRMVALLLDAGGDPSATPDNPLEEAIRNQSPRMIELVMRAGAAVPAGARGQELFRLAQRGERARELTGILLDHGADPDLCLAAATAAERIAMMALCLDRGADPNAVPVEPNLLGVALRSGQQPMIDRLLGAGLEARVVAGALPAAVAVGDREMVRRALENGAVPSFADLETAVSRRQPEIALALLEKSDGGEADFLTRGDVSSLIQQAEDLGFTDVARALRHKSGQLRWPLASMWPLAVMVALLLIGALLLVRGRRGSTPTVAVSGLGPAPSRTRPKPPAPAASAVVAPAAPAAAVPDPPPPPATRRSAAETVPIPEPAPPPAERGMPPVALTPAAAEVFAAARREAAAEPKRAVLVTPERELAFLPSAGRAVTDRGEIAEWRRVLPSHQPGNVAVIAFTADAGENAARAIPFLALIQKLSALSYAVWIFEGHVSALAAGFEDADVVLVDDGMMPYLPGNWRSVAGRAMRGSDILLYERKTKTLRRLS